MMAEQQPFLTLAFFDGPTRPADPAVRHARITPGFTLVELLVVIGVIALLISFLLPSLSRARADAQRTACASNLRQIGIAAQMYAQENNNCFPPAWISAACRWMDLIGRYISKGSQVYQCPSDPRRIPDTYDPTIILSYGINSFNFSGNRWCFWYGVVTTDVHRSSETILFADCTPGVYWCGGGNTFSSPVYSVGYRHVNSSFNAVFCDGHAETLSSTTRPAWDASQ